MVKIKDTLNLNLKNKKVFISGSTKGIGYETARLFLDEGAKVIINGRTKSSLDDALSKLNNKNASGIITDLIDDSQVEKLIHEIPDDIDILINNVGIFRGKNFFDERFSLFGALIFSVFPFIIYSNGLISSACLQLFFYLLFINLINKSL